MIVLHCFSIFMILAITVYELRRKSTSIFLWVGNCVFFALPHTISCIMSIYDGRILGTASAFSLLFCLCYIFCRILTKKQPGIKINLDKCNQNKANIRKRYMLLLYFTRCVSSLTYCFAIIIFSGGVGAISHKIVYEYMGSSPLVLLIEYLMQFSAPVLIYFVVKQDRWKTCVVILTILSVSVLSSSRSHLIIIFVAFALYIISKVKKISIKQFVGLTLVGCFAIYMMYLLRAFRYYYNISDLLNFSQLKLNEKALHFFTKQDGDIFLNKFFYELIKIENKFDGLGKGSGYIRLLLLPIPSSLCFGLKPEDICITVGRIFGVSATSAIKFTMTPTLFGDCYANFGFFGFLSGTLWAGIVTLLDELCRNNDDYMRLTKTLIVCNAYMNIARGSVYNAMCSIFWSFVFFEILNYSVKKIRFSIFEIRFRI